MLYKFVFLILMTKCVYGTIYIELYKILQANYRNTVYQKEDFMFFRDRKKRENKPGFVMKYIIFGCHCKWCFLKILNANYSLLIHGSAIDFVH